MIKKYINAISEVLFNAFGTEYDIFTEKIEQGLDKKSFLISCLSPSLQLDLGTRYKNNISFIIQFIPLPGEEMSECYGILERLFDLLTDISIDDKIVHENEMHGEITDGILNFTISYETFVRKVVAPEESMGIVSVKTGVKG